MKPRTGRPLTLHESAARLGHYRYVELQLFESLGRRVTTASPSAASFFSGASMAHGWRASLIERRLPVSVGLPTPEVLTVPHSDALSEVFDAVTGGSDAEVLDGLLGSLYPAMAAGYADHLAICSPASDPPIARLLGRLASDLDGLRREAATLAGSLVTRASNRRPMVDDVLVRVDGPFGSLLVTR